jgi:hypothetical protein
MISIKLSREEKKEIVERVAAFFAEERGEAIGHLAAASGRCPAFASEQPLRSVMIQPDGRRFCRRQDFWRLWAGIRTLARSSGWPSATRGSTGRRRVKRASVLSSIAETGKP